MGWRSEIQCINSFALLTIVLYYSFFVCFFFAVQLSLVIFFSALAPHPCRTNLCSDESEGLFCKPGNAIHIREAFCVNPDTECNWNILHTLYILCEGKVVCYASGLRLFMPNSTCLNSLPRNANLLVDYICIPGKGNSLVSYWR